jgi:hypothetical protein
LMPHIAVILDLLAHHELLDLVQLLLVAPEVLRFGVFLFAPRDRGPEGDGCDRLRHPLAPDPACSAPGSAARQVCFAAQLTANTRARRQNGRRRS